MNRDLAHSSTLPQRSGVPGHAAVLIGNATRRALWALLAVASLTPASAFAEEGGWRPPGYDGPIAADQPASPRTPPARSAEPPIEEDDPLDEGRDDIESNDDDDGRPSPWNVALDVALGVAQVEFPAVDLPEEVTAMTGQAPASRTTETVRLIASAGFGGFSLEGGLTTSLSGGDYMGWLLGIRLESSWDSAFAIAFRAAYVDRTDVSGQGARVGIGVIGRPMQLLSIYGEAWTEATTIPDGMHMTGALFSYVVAGSAGVRVAFR